MKLRQHVCSVLAVTFIATVACGGSAADAETGPAAAKDDHAAAWLQPLSIALPPRARSIVLNPGTDPTAWLKAAGLGERDDVTTIASPRGTTIEAPLDDPTWAALEQDQCASDSVSLCESSSCRHVQLTADVSAPDDTRAEAIQSRLVAKSDVATMPEEDAACAGPLAAVRRPVTERASRDLTFYAEFHKPSTGATGAASRSTGTPASPGPTGIGEPTGFEPGRLGAEPSAQQAAAGAPNSSGGLSGNAGTTAGGANADAGAASQPGQPPAQLGQPGPAGELGAAPAETASFAFEVASQLTSVASQRLTAPKPPADSSDWDLKVGAGCSEVSVPLDYVEPAFEPNRVVALVAAGDVSAVAQQYLLVPLWQRRLEALQEHLVVFVTLDDPAQVTLELRRDSRVLAAQKEHIFTTTAETAYSDPFAPLTYGPGKLDALVLHPRALGSGQRVAMIDTGVDANHPDLVGRVTKQANTTDEPWGADGHGTAIAGIIAASANNGTGAYGIAPQVELFAIKACQPKAPGSMRSRCWSSTLAAALDAAIVDGAPIINMSVAGPPDALVARYVQAALDKGQLVVAAAGNGGPHAKPSYPGALPGVLAVTALDANDRLWAQASQGPHVDVAAPGVDIVTSAPNGSYPSVSGTSMATAYVAGAAALLRQLQPDLTAEQLRGAIDSHTGDLGSSGRDPRFGNGLVSACRSAEAVTGETLGCATPPALGEGA